MGQSHSNSLCLVPVEKHGTSAAIVFIEIIFVKKELNGFHFICKLIINSCIGFYKCREMQLM